MRNIIKSISLFLFLFISCFILVGCHNNGTANNKDENKEYKINFYVEGEKYKEIITSGNELVIMPENPNKDGFKFKGWYLDKDLWITQFTANSLLQTTLTEDINVYAYFEKEILDNTGFKFKDSVFVEENELYKKYSIVVPNSVSLLSFAHYVDVNNNCTWTVSTDIAGVHEITSKITELVEGNNSYFIQVYDKTTNEVKSYNIEIRRRPIYQVSFNTNGGTKCQSVSVEEDGFLTAPSTTKTGYTFSRWDFDFNNPIKSDLVINAEWTKNEYCISFNTFDINVKVEDLDVTFDENATLPIPERLGYSFEGWYFNNDIVSNGKWIIPSNVTLDAKWIPNKYNIQYNLEGGTISNNPNTYTYGVVTTIPNPTKEGYNFAGWYINNNKDERFIDYEISPNTYGKLELTASWKTEEYTISFVDSDGTLLYSITQEYNTVIDQEIPIPEKPGFYFNYWYTEIPDTMPNYNLTIRAVWKYVTDVLEIINGKITSVLEDNLDDFVIPRYYLNKYTNSIEEVTSIGEYAFKRSRTLNSITIPNSIQSIDPLAFCDCSSLKKIVIEDGMTEIKRHAFFRCPALESIEMPNSITSVGFGAFSNCSKLEKVYYKGTLEDWLNILFEDEYSNPLQNNTSLYVLDENSSFQLVTNLVIPSTISSINDYQFIRCSSITSLVVSGNVKIIGDYSFAECANLKTIEIKSGVYTIGNYAFKGCESLQSVNIKPGLTSIGDSAFDDNLAIKTLNIPNTVINIGTNIFDAKFNNNINLNSYDNGLYFGDSDNPYIFFVKVKDKNITSCNIHENTKFILEYAFEECTKLRSIDIPSNVIFIGASSFSYCDTLSSINIPDGVTYIGGDAFGDCSSLKTVKLPNTISKLNAFTFGNCTNLLSIEIPGNIKEIATGAFFGCSNLVSVIMEEGVESIGKNAFKYCYSLSQVEIPNSISHIDYDVFNSNNLKYTVYENAEYLGNSLNPYVVCVKATYDYSDSNKLHEKTKIILYNAFSEKSITQFTMPDSVVEVGDNAFYNCMILEKIALSNSLETIGRYAFCGCKSLESIEIPDSVRTIYAFAFAALNVKTVFIPKTVEYIESGVFNMCKNLTIYCEVESCPNSWYIQSGNNTVIYWGCTKDQIPQN